MMNIILVDDYLIFKTGLKLIIEQSENLKVCGEASNPEELYQLMNNTDVDIILLSLTLPQEHVFGIIDTINNLQQKIPVILLADSATEFVILECVIRGVKGIIWKENNVNQLLEAIHTALAGKHYINIPESRKNGSAKIYNEISNPSLNKTPDLTLREIEVIKLFTEGHSYKMIGDKLNISPRTVESHKNNILSKLNLTSTVDLVKYAIRHKLTE